MATVEIQRPPNNFFDEDLITALADTFEALDEETDVRAIVLAAQGKHFCAGANFTSPSRDPEKRRRQSQQNKQDSCCPPDDSHLTVLLLQILCRLARLFTGSSTLTPIHHSQLGSFSPTAKVNPVIHLQTAEEHRP